MVACAAVCMSPYIFVEKIEKLKYEAISFDWMNEIKNELTVTKNNFKRLKKIYYFYM